MIKGAVFDMDGLMFDSERLVYEIWQSMLDEIGLEYNIDIYKNTVGLRADNTEKYYKSIYGKDFDYAALKAKSRQLFYERVERDGVPVKKGLFELLEYLKTQNIKISLATSTSSQTALKLLKMAKVYDYFDAFVCGDDVKNGKPHPEVFLTAAERLKLAPESCAAFEDSINGIKSASAAGMKTVMVPDFLQPTDEVLSLIDFICEDLSQAIKYIENENIAK